MRPGDTLRLRGPAGAPFAVTVGVVFTAADIERRLASGEWRHLDEAPPVQGEAPTDEDPPPSPAPADPSRPPQSAPKSAWIAYVVRAGKLSADDAANYTKADLIEIAS